MPARKNAKTAPRKEKSRRYAPPSPPPTCIPRKRLFRALSAAFASGDLVCVGAPAGYGKTTAIAMWLREENVSAVWVSIDPYDDIPSLFYGRLCRALCQIWRGSGLETVIEQADFSASPVEHTLFALQHLPRPPGGRVALILDDCHHLPFSTLAGSLPYVLKRLPEEVCTILSGRGDAAYRAFGTSAVRIGPEKLRFSAGEVRACLNAFGCLNGEGEPQKVLKSTDGWPIAVASLASSTPADAPTAARSKEEVLEDCLWKHFWEPCDDRTRSFLLKTCVVETLSAELCARLAGERDASAILHAIGANGLLTHSVENPGEKAYVHHHLFRDFLRERLAETAGLDESALYVEASNYYMEAGDFYLAIHYALKSGCSDNIAPALRKVLHTVRHTSVEEHLSKIRAYIAGKVPESLLEKYPYLYASLAWYYNLVGDREGMFHAFDRLYGNLPRIRQEEGDFVRTAVVIGVLDHRSPMQDLLKTGDTSDREAHNWSVPASPALSKNMPFLHRGARDMSGFPGLPDDPEPFRRFIGVIAVEEVRAILVATACSGIALEQNRLSLALHHAAEADAGVDAQLGRNCPDTPLTAEVYLVAKIAAAAALDAMGRRSEAAAKRAKIAGRLGENDALYLLPNFYAYEAKLSMQDGDVQAVDRWLDNYFVATVLREKSVPLELFRIGQHQTTARALAAQGEPDVARAFIRRLLRLAEDFDRVLDQAEALVILSILEWHRGDPEEALRCLEAALDCARPYRYVRVLSDEGAAIAGMTKKLMNRAAHTGRGMGYDLEFLKEVHMEAAARGLRRGGLVRAMQLEGPHLTGREKEVLSMLARGWNRPDIAARTGMSYNTVKVHTVAAYRKLDAHSAVEAVAKAREQKLIE